MKRTNREVHPPVHENRGTGTSSCLIIDDPYVKGKPNPDHDVVDFIRSRAIIAVKSDLSDLENIGPGVGKAIEQNATTRINLNR